MELRVLFGVSEVTRLLRRGLGQSVIKPRQGAGESALDGWSQWNVFPLASVSPASASS